MERGEGRGEGVYTCKGTLSHPYPKGTDETLYHPHCARRGTEIAELKKKKSEGDTQRQRGEECASSLYVLWGH